MDSIMVGQKIKEAREAANLTLEELGLKIGMPKTNLSRLENGKHKINVETIDKIAQALNCDLKIELEPKLQG